MNIARFIGFNLSVAAVLLVVSGQSEAGYVALPSSLDALTGTGNYTTLGNATVTFAGYSSTTNGGVALPSSSIAVDAITGPPVGFELTGPMAAEAGSQNDIAISYMVTTTGTGFSQVGLIANGATNGGGIAEVTEDIYTDMTKKVFLGQMSVTAGSVFTDLGGLYTSLYVTKNIIYNAYNQGDTASFSIIDQTFTSPSSVPEPASIATMGLGLGLAGLYAFARARREAVID